MQAMREATDRIEYICVSCGGTAVTREAWAEWSLADQQWALCQTFDFAFCHQCHRETRLEARPLARPAN
ncbi:MAG: hypothetical protein CMN73_09385 [Sphingomonas sp.]|nr:hypothetical protein [Sphingomonas sp.]|tara:strand:+ start:598 stop:804 length:207 start_codon:yes stop_codon:yes gene_type:complete